MKRIADYRCEDIVVSSQRTYLDQEWRCRVESHFSSYICYRTVLVPERNVKLAKVVWYCKPVLTSLFSGRFVLSDLSSATFEMRPCLREKFLQRNIYNSAQTKTNCNEYLLRSQRSVANMTSGCQRVKHWNSQERLLELPIIDRSVQIQSHLFLFTSWATLRIWLMTQKKKSWTRPDAPDASLAKNLAPISESNQDRSLVANYLRVNQLLDFQDMWTSCRCLPLAYIESNLAPLAASGSCYMLSCCWKPIRLLYS